jgi:hypothetical protein
MDQRTADACVYPALALATTLYAVVLDHNKRYAPPERKIEPDGTLMEVVIGDAICLIAGAIRAYLGPNDRWSAVRAMGLAFIVGGTPIACWQRLLIEERRRQARDTLQHDNPEQHHATRSAPAPTGPAARRWPGAIAHRRNGQRPG